MLAQLASGSTPTLVLLGLCFLLVLVFEFSNGFHDTANAVATVIYTHALKPMQAVVWSGLCNFAGVLLGGIAVAYALVEILPPEVLSPPDGGAAVGMLIALFVSALGWNLLTWLFGIPNSSSHALIGSLIGIAVASSIERGHPGQGVQWKAILDVLEGLLASPLLGFLLAFLLFQIAKGILNDRNLFQPPEDGEAPVWWMRGLLILTCTGVSFAHGTNDGQKSIGLIMLTIIGLLPATYSINIDTAPNALRALQQDLERSASLIERYGNEQKSLAGEAAASIRKRLATVGSLTDVKDADRVAMRNETYQVLAQLELVENGSRGSKDDRAAAKSLRKKVGELVAYAPFWVRILSALALGCGTMIGYKRIVTTLGERLGKQHLVPAQGAAAEIVAAGLIGGAGVTGFPVSTTHVVTAGIAGTMVGAKAGLNTGMVWQIIAAWVLTLPVTILASGGLFLLFTR
jgi:inorganic phosphate transporter, PiT family